MELLSPKRFAATFEERCGLVRADLKQAVHELCEAVYLAIEGRLETPMPTRA